MYCIKGVTVHSGAYCETSELDIIRKCYYFSFFSIENSKNYGAIFPRAEYAAN